jgi:uncharacterized protein (DUF433 family)
MEVPMTDPHIEERDGGLYIKGSRVSLESVVYSFKEGFSPEVIRSEHFPSLSLAQIYRTIAFYLDHQASVDRYLEECAREWDESESRGVPVNVANPVLAARLERYTHHRLGGLGP